MTNYERIKAMSIEELAHILIEYRDDWGDYWTSDGERYFEEEDAVQGQIEWLESEVAE